MIGDEGRVKDEGWGNCAKCGHDSSLHGDFLRDVWTRCWECGCSEALDLVVYLERALGVP